MRRGNLALKVLAGVAAFVATLYGLVLGGLLPRSALPWMAGPDVQVGKGPGLADVGRVDGEGVVHLVPRFHQIPAFDLVESSGQRFTNETLKGKVWIASFIFTHCASTCPGMTYKTQAMQKTLPEGVVLVSVSVDPTRDTPEVLSEYAAFNHRVDGKWFLLTGKWEAISELAMKGFYLGGDSPLLHSTRFALVDAEGWLRGYYDSKEESEMAKLLTDVALVLAEGQEASEGPAR